MPQNGRPPRFKPFSAPRALSLQMKSDKGIYRTSPRDRGYDSRWDRLSIKFRKNNPFCRFCAQVDRDEIAAVVDHIIPVSSRPDLIYDWHNLQSLCLFHHGRKGLMEEYARKNNQVDQLPAWCEAIANRPIQFRPAGA